MAIGTFFGMTAQSDSSDQFRTSLLGTKFCDANSEAQFKNWRIGSGIPFARIGYIGSAPSWIAFLIAVALLNPEVLPTAGPAISGWVLILVLLTALTVTSSMQRWVMVLAALANCIAGTLVAWLLHEVIAPPLSAASRAGIMTGGVLIVLNFGFAIFRIPPRLALTGITPYLAVSLYFLSQDHLAGHLNSMEAGAFSAILLIAYSGGYLVCTTIELVTRRNFVNSKIIEQQQAALSETRDAIRRYVPDPVANHIIAGDRDGVEAPTRRRITILFCDIVGFTEIADRIEPEVMTQVLGEYLSTMADLVEQHGGTVNEFAGDGLMALFGAPDEMAPQTQAETAIETSVAMQNAMPNLNEQWRILGLGSTLAVRIGINSGMVSVGSYGSKGRMTYTAVGLQTNIASRIEGAADPGSIWVSDSTYQLARNRFDFRKLGLVECKGMHYPVQVYSPMGKRVA